MRVVWKFQLKVEDVQGVILPFGAVIMCVQAQHEQPMLWAHVDPDEQRRETRVFRIVGTGHPMPDEKGFLRHHVGTFQLAGGDLVFHVFEELRL